MATSTQGQVLSLQGSVKAIGVDGKVRILKVGDILQPGEQLQLENGAAVSISRADGEVMRLDGDRQVMLTEEVLHAQHADAAEASIAPLAPEAQQILAALDNPAANPGNPFDSLDPAAAGLNDAGGENSGHSFVRIGRISESLTGLQLEAAQASAAQVPENRAADVPAQNSPPFFTAANGAPLGSDMNVTTDEDTPVSGTLTASDPNGDPLTFVKGSDPQHGTVTVNPNGTWTYTPAQDYNGSDKFTVTVSDGRGGSATVTVNIGITPVNDPAVITGNDQGAVTEDQNVSAANTLDYSGKLNVADPDQGEAVFNTTRIDNKTANLGSITIDANGNWHYSVDNAKVQYLGQGETRTEVFTVYSKDGTAHDITVVVTGVNDAAVITGNDQGAVTEDANVSAINTLDYVGKLNVSDVDQGQSSFDTARVDNKTANLGSITIDANGNWHYSVDNAKVQYLGQGDTRTEVFTVYSKDGTAHDITVVVTGVNDAAVITGNDQGAVTEDANVSATNTLDYVGKLNVSDADQGQAVFDTSRVDNKTTNLGSITIDANGNWHYSVDNAKVQYLGQGDTRTEVFTVYSKDGTAHDITVVVTGVNDPADVGHGAGDIGSGVVKEDTVAQTVASGKLTVIDPDQGQAQLQPYQQVTDYGTFQANADGTWTFTIDNSSAKVQALGEGDKVPLQFTVLSKDGTGSAVVSIQVLGTNDAATFSGNDTGSVTEDKNVSSTNTLDYVGKLNVSDVDQGQAVFDTSRVDNKTSNLGSITIDANGNWHYSVDNAKVQYLGQGDTRTEVFTVYSKDGTAHDITVVVTGVNDAAVISGNDQGAVTEDTNVSSSKTLDYVGKLDVSDVDQGQAVFNTSRVDSKTANLGSITIDANGNWHYSVDNAKVQYLGQGDTRTEVFTVYSKDGTAHDITVVINGVNDPAIIGGTDHGVVVEDDIPKVEGTLLVKDVDQNQSAFQPMADVQVDYGTFHFDSASGKWTFTLDNAKAQELTSADRFDRTFTVHSVDGTPHVVTITIQGKDDPAEITGNDQGAVTEDLNVSAANTLDYNGKLDVVDPDKGQAVFDTSRIDSKTANLGSITIDANGNWHYSVDNAKVQYLGQGETRTEVFTVYSKDGTAHDITVVVTGVNDAAVITGNDQGAVTEDSNVSAINTLDYVGKLNVSDVDQGQSSFDTARVDNKTANLGSITIDANGNWHYSVDNAKVQYLGQGDTRTEVFTVYSKDGTAHDITVVVTGVNDAAVITGNDQGAVTEDANVSATNTLDYAGKLNVSDADQGQAVFDTSRVDNKTTNLGSITIDANGNWHYSVDNAKVQYLGQGDTRTEVFTVYSKDGTAHDITVVVTGVNDAAVITGNDQGAVTEDSNVSAANTLDYVGKLNVSDADQGQAVFDTSRVDNKTTNLGSITIDANGNWHYSVDNAKVQYLGQGDTRTEVFTVYSKDGTAHDITVVVTGVNDAAVITGNDQGAVTEDANVSAINTLDYVGKLNVSDADQGQAVFDTSRVDNKTTNLGSITIDANGNWHYSVDNAKVQYLGQGDTRTEVFTVYSKDGTAHDITVVVTGVNDAAVISGNDQGAVTEDANVSATNTLDYVGKLNVSDVDQGQAVFDTSRVDNKTSNLGSITIDANGNWHYSVDNAKVQYLGQGDTRTEVFTVYSKDGTAHDITVVVTGVNDAAVISGNDQGAVTEDTNVSSSKTLDYVGKLDVSDVDQGQAVFNTSRVDSKTANLGSITIDANGNWHYSVDNAKVQYLGQGDTRTEVFTVYSKDGTAHDITVVINGVNDPAIIGGTDHGVVVEDDIPKVEGTLLVKDVDQNQSAFQPMADVQVDYGTFHFDSASGKWTFTLDNAKAQELTSADRFDRTFTVHSVDGTPHVVTITIQGKDDPAEITGNDQGAVTEDLNVSAANTLDYNGKLDVVDPDKGQAVFDTSRIDSKTANLGSITIDANGNWHYSVDNAKVQYLGQGETRTEVFTVYSKDGTAHDITVVVTGVNDAAVITGNDQGAVTEDSNVSAINTLDYVGKLNVSDVDQGQSSFDTARVDNKTANLGSITIDANGNWHYSVDNAKVQYLGQGDTRTEVFTVYSKDGTAHDITVVVTGVNDAAVITGNDQGAVTEDANVSATNTLDYAGKLNVSDADQGQAVFDTSRVDNKTTNLGSITIDANGNWHYSVDNAKVQYLGQGDTRTEVFTVYSKDGTAHDITVVVTGVNDAAVITGNDQGAVTEDSNVSAANTLDYVGKLNVSDADQGQAVFDTSRVDNKTTNLGSITIDANGNWHYSVDNAKVQYLGQGDTRTEVFTVYSKDGTAHDITVVVTGVNDAAVITGNDQGAVTEDANVSAINTLDYVGKLNVSDADQGQAVFDTSRVDNKTTNLGSITIDANGNWHYSVDNAKVQYLGQGDTRTEVFTVYSKDGTAHDITVVVTGVNDAAVISGNDQGAVTEDANVSATNTLDYVGKLNVSDVDQGQAVFDTSRVDNKTSNLGSITIDANGNWHYSVDNAKVQYLGQGDTRTEVFTVYSKDGTAHDITVVVTGVNDAAVISGNDQGAVTEDTNVSSSKTLDYVGKLDVSDVDQGQAVFNTSRVDSKTANLGSITIDANGNWHYSVDNAKVQYLGQGDTRTEVFTVYSKDGTAHDITVVVTGVNDPADVGHGAGDIGSGVVKEDTVAQTVASGKLTVIDPDQGQAQLQPYQQVTDYGTFQANADGTWTFTIDNSSAKVQALGEGDKVPLQFTVLSKDGTGSAVVSIQVLGTNDAATFSGNDTGSVTEDKNVSSTNTLDYVGKLNVSDVDQGQSVFDTSRVDNKTANLGKLTIDANGNWHYSVDDAKVQYLGQDVTRTEVFTVYSKDGTSHDITVTIKGVNDPAVFGGTDGATLVEGTFPSATGTLLVRDVDAGEAAFRPQADVQVKYGTFHFDSATGQWTFTLNDAAQELTSQDKINYTFPVQSLDGTSHNVNITVYGTDNFAVITGNDKGAVTEDVAVSADGMLVHNGKLDIATPDKGRAAFDTGRVDSHAGNYGTLTIDKDGHWHYQVDNAKVQYLGQDETRTEVFTVYAKDGTEHKISVDVHGTNDAPVFVGDQTHGFAKDGGIQVTTAEDTPVSGQLRAQDVDANDQLSYTASGNPQHGTVVLGKDGSWTYTPSQDYNGSDSFKVTVTDKAGATDTITIHVGITPVDDPSVLKPDSGNVVEDKTLAVDAAHGLLANDYDVDSKLSVQSVTVAGQTYQLGKQGVDVALDGKGVLHVNADGSYSFAPAAHYAGELPQIGYTTNTGSSSTLTLTMTPVADAPVVGVQIGQGSYQPGSPYVGGRNFESWEKTAAEYGKNAITLDDGNNSFADLRGKTDTGFAVRGMGGNDAIYLDTSKADNVLIGDDGNLNQLSGKPNEVNDTLYAGKGNDILIGGKGDDSLYGGDGVDTAVYAGNFKDYTVTRPVIGAGGSVFFEVTDKQTTAANPYAGEGHDSLYDIERLQFKDGTYYWNGKDWAKEGPDLTRYPIDISASLVDRDGSEVLDSIVIRLDAKYAGSQLFDNQHNLIGTIGKDGSLTIAQAGHWDAKALDVKLSGLQLEVPGSVKGALSIGVDAVSRETGNGDTATGHAGANAANMAPETFDVSASGMEDQPLISVALSGKDGDGSVSGFVIKDLPTNGTLYSDAAGTQVVKAGDTVGGAVYFKPTAHWSGDTGFGYAAKDNQGAVDASPAKASIHVEAVADAPQLSLGGYSSLASLNFEDVNLGGREWRQDVAVNKIGGANTIGVWNTDNGRGLIEVGTERTYTGGSSTNKVLEIENGPGDRTLYTDIQCEAGRFYQLGFDISARTNYVSSSQLQVKLIALDASGHPTGKATVLYDFNPTSTGWLRDQQVALPIAEDGKYRLMFEAKDGDSYGAILDNLSFKAMDNVGYEGNFIKLSSISASLVDRDGSETLNVSLSGLPSGAVLKDASGHQATVDGSGRLDISNWSLDSLQLKGPAGYHGQLNLTVTATATEQSNHSQASSSQNLSVSIQAVDHPVTLSGLHALDGGNDAIVQESHLAAGTAPDAAQLTQQGSFVVNAPDGVASIRIGGVEVVGADGRLTGSILNTAYGALKVTSFDAASGKLGYQYTLGHAGANAGERFIDSLNVEVRDRDGSSASDKLNVAIVNDAPLAADDRASLAVLSGDLKISSNGIVGNWVDWDGGHRVSAFNQGGNDDGKNQLRWGDTYGQQSGYSFRDNDLQLNNTLPLNQTFKLGDLTHLNYEISGNSGISNATLGLSFMLGAQPQQFLVHLNHQETPNSRDYEASKDIVTIDNASQTFEYNGRQYILQILGFDDGKGHIGNEIHTAENANSTFGIMARIVEGSDFHHPATGGDVLQNDAAGADGGLKVVACASGGQAGNGGVEAILHGQFGDLLMHADGSYNYTFTGDSKLLGQGKTDTFTYTVRDADGDLSSARLHIDLSALDPNQRLIQGDAGDNRLTGTDASELIRGGAGNDILTGGAGVDTFKWSLGDQGTAAKPARDVITDFGQHGEKDVLDLKDLLQGESHNAASLEGYLNFHKEGANTVIDVHHQGQGTPVTQQIVLQNVDLTQGATLSDAQVLKNLLNHGQLHTD